MEKKVSSLTRALIASLSSKPKYIVTSGDTITISHTVSALALLYEKIRTSIEYREEHLLRRAAIERIIKRRLILNENGRGIAEYLIKEILWAKYIPENSVSISKIHDIQVSIDKYIYLRNELSRGKSPDKKRIIFEWLISSMAAEIEEKLSPDYQREAFIHFIYQYYKDKVTIVEEEENIKNIQVYIAVHRAFAKSDNDYIRYSLLKLFYDNLTKKTWKDFTDSKRQIYMLLQDIDTYLHHPIGQKLARCLKKEIAPFLILRDLYEENPEHFASLLSNEKQLENKIDKMCSIRYEDIQKRLSRAGKRSIIYIFITKMILALGIEYPFERYLLGHFNIVSLSINTIFPPILMYLALVGNKAPGKDNTERIITRIKNIVYRDVDLNHNITITLKAGKKRPFLLALFTLFYLVAYIIVFGVIAYMLNLIHFSIISQLIFMFFVSVILFFAYRIRQTGKEYYLVEKESVLSPVINFFLLPILNVGKWLSNEVARFNFFIAIFDYLIEAPFKTIFEVFEEWFKFMRKQKEEIL